MTIPNEDRQSTAVERSRESIMTPQMRASLQERKEWNALVNTLRGQVWAKENMSESQVKAVAEWATRNGIDPVREVDVLGGRVYVNANYALRKLSELTHAGYIESHGARWIHYDARLEEEVKAGEEWALKEMRERRRERIMRAVPEASTEACVYWIKVRSLDEPVCGVKYHEQGKVVKRKKSDGSTYNRDADPIGDQAPIETVETRALRRAMRALVSIIPGLSAIEQVISEEGKAVSRVLQDAREEERRQAALTPTRGDEKLLAAADYTSDAVQQIPQREPVPELVDMGEERNTAARQDVAGEMPNFVEEDNEQLHARLRNDATPEDWRTEILLILDERSEQQ
jgi:hypothetical protein